MNTPARLLNVLVRVFGGGALALGLAFWMGYARSLTGLHMGFGIGLVVSLWALAAMAWRNTAAGGLVALAALLGLVTWILGFTQTRILPGSSHWLVEVAHLALGVTSIAVARRVVGAAAEGRIAASIRWWCGASSDRGGAL